MSAAIADFIAVNGDFVRAVEQVYNDVATIAHHFPLWSRRLIQNENASFAFRATRDPSGIHAVRTGRVCARVATAQSLFHVPVKSVKKKKIKIYIGN